MSNKLINLKPGDVIPSDALGDVGLSKAVLQIEGRDWKIKKKRKSNIIKPTAREMSAIERSKNNG